MYILGIESSCDETAASVIERGERNRVLSAVIKSQIPLHAKYGGVVPEIASRSHYEVIDMLVDNALRTARLTVGDIDLMAVTQGPGLIGSLLIGLSFAKGLAFRHNIPLVPVDHIDAHLESPFIDHPDIQYPLLALVVSGGHTTLFYRENKFSGHILAKTRDDAAGEVMDKIAKHFDIGYPGGPVLDKLYPKGDPGIFSFTIPKMSDGSDDFSFSGYKTAVLRHAQLNDIKKDTQPFYDLISSFMNAVVEYLLKRTKEYAETLNPKSILIAGGVSRNTLLRQKFSEAFASSDIEFYMASPEFCTDNATMIAWLGYEKYTTFTKNNYFDPYLNSYSRAQFKKPKRHR